MENTFLNRVSAERRVLAVVNAQLQSNQQLTGLSEAAITRWRSILGIEKTSSMYPILVTLAEQCQRLSDRSNETFMPIEKSDSEKIDQQIVVLKNELERCM